MSVNPMPNSQDDPNEEILDALREIAELEAALGLEIGRLRKAYGLSEAVKPLWWWRTMLLRWTGASRTRQMHAWDLLEGLTYAIQDFGDDQLRDYLEAVERAGRKTA